MEPTKNTTILKYMIPFVLINSLLYPISKDALNYSSPFAFLALRFLIASPVLFLLRKNLRPKFNRDTILLSTFTLFANSFWILGLAYVSAAESAVLSYTMPFFAIPVSLLILKERPTIWNLIGTAVGIIGVWMYSLALITDGETFLGAVLTLLNAVFYAFFVVYYRKLGKQDSMATVATQSIFLSAFYLALTPIGFEIVLSQRFLLDLSFVSILGSVVMYYLWSTMSKLERVGRVTTFIFAVPAVTLAYQVALTRTFPSPVSLVGVGLMFLGIYTSRITRSKPA